MATKTKNDKTAKEQPGEERFVATGKGVQLLSSPKNKRRPTKPKGAK